MFSLYLPNSGWVRLIRNTAGEWEQEAKSRRFNATEPILIMLLILVTLWPFCYLFGVLPGNKWVQNAAVVPLFIGSLYLLFVSPWIHRDTPEAWGLGNPRRLAQYWRQGSWVRKVSLVLAMGVVFCGLNYMNYSHWADVVKFIGARSLGWQEWKSSAGGRLGIFLFGCLLSSFILLFAIRYDNFLSAFRTALFVAVPLFALICLGAYAQRGTAAFRGFQPSKFFLDVFGYVFWGFVQQLLFSSFFGTRFRKAFAPSRAHNNTRPVSERISLALRCGVGTAIVLSLGLFVTVRALYPSNLTPPQLILWLMAFTFPFGAAFGWFYGKDRKRLLVSVLAASCFGLIHIDSYGLVLVTWMLGTILVYVFMEDRNRNLVALGFIHGLLGSSFNWLFSSRESGALEVDYRVGPWNVEEPTAGVLVIPLLCIAAYLILLAYVIRSVNDEPEDSACADSNRAVLSEVASA